MYNRIINVCDKENIWTCSLYITSLIFIFPFSNIMLPLGIWLWKKEDSDFIKEHGKNALNFQLSLVCLMLSIATFLILIWSMIGFVVSDLFAILLAFSFGTYIFLLVADFVFMLTATIYAYKRKMFPIKCSFQFIK